MAQVSLLLVETVDKASLRLNLFPGQTLEVPDAAPALPTPSAKGDLKTPEFTLTIESYVAFPDVGAAELLAPIEY